MNFSPPPNKQRQPSLNPEQFAVCYKYCAADIVSENGTVLLGTSHRFNSNFYMMELNSGLAGHNHVMQCHLFIMHELALSD